jgi:hypothetical protein
VNKSVYEEGGIAHELSQSHAIVNPQAADYVFDGKPLADMLTRPRPAHLVHLANTKRWGIGSGYRHEMVKRHRAEGALHNTAPTNTIDAWVQILLDGVLPLIPREPFWSTKHIQAFDDSPMGYMANTAIPQSSQTNNCTIEWLHFPPCPAPIPVLRASRDLKKGEEILIPYSAAQHEWFDNSDSRLLRWEEWYQEPETRRDEETGLMMELQAWKEKQDLLAKHRAVIAERDREREVKEAAEAADYRARLAEEELARPARLARTASLVAERLAAKRAAEAAAAALPVFFPNRPQPSFSRLQPTQLSPPAGPCLTPSWPPLSDHSVNVVALSARSPVYYSDTDPDLSWRPSLYSIEDILRIGITLKHSGDRYASALGEPRWILDEAAATCQLNRVGIKNQSYLALRPDSPPTDEEWNTYLQSQEYKKMRELHYKTVQGLVQPFVCSGLCCKDQEDNFLMRATWKMNSTNDGLFPCIDGSDETDSRRVLDSVQQLTGQVDQWIKEHNRLFKIYNDQRQRVLLQASYGCKAVCCCCAFFEPREDESHSIPVYFGDEELFNDMYSEPPYMNCVPITRQRSKVQLEQAAAGVAITHTQ